MALKKYKPVTPGQRQLVLVDRTGLHKGPPVKALTSGQKRPAGRNNLGRITVRWQGGGHKQSYRIIDFKRARHDQPATVQQLEYDPNRTSFIALIKYRDGELAYIIAPQRLAITLVEKLRPVHRSPSSEIVGHVRTAPNWQKKENRPPMRPIPFTDTSAAQRKRSTLPRLRAVVKKREQILFAELGSELFARLRQTFHQSGPRHLAPANQMRAQVAHRGSGALGKPLLLAGFQTEEERLEVLLRGIHRGPSYYRNGD